MNSSKFAVRALAAIAVAASAVLSQAQAAPVITVVPSDLNPGFGSALGVDIMLSGITQAVGGFSFTLTYDAALLTFGSYVADPDTKMGSALFPADDYSVGHSGNTVSVDILAGFFGGDPNGADSEAALFALQGAGFKLAHVDFTAGAAPGGLANLNLTAFSLGDFTGGLTIASTAVNAQVCVGGNCGAGPNPIPEPSSMLLLATAVVGLLVSSKARRA